MVFAFRSFLVDWGASPTRSLRRANTAFAHSESHTDSAALRKPQAGPCAGPERKLGPPMSHAVLSVVAARVTVIIQVTVPVALAVSFSAVLSIGN